MTWIDLTWTAVAGAGLAYALVALFAIARSIRRVPRLAALDPPEPPRWPSLTIVVPACNEGKTLEVATRAKLAEGYPDVEIVLIDDRSTDETGEIVDRLAAADGRVTPVHIQYLPDGWLGKLHAMREGLARARGDWVLFSDADVHLEPGCLRRAVALCLARGLDHLAVFPEIWPTRFHLDACTAAFTRLIYVTGRLWAVADPAARAYAGVGAFNLVRRAALEATPGLEWLRLEVADDMALGQMMKRSGARSLLCNGAGQVGLRFYTSVAEMARSAEKGATAFRFSLAAALAASAAMLFVELAGPLALALASGPGRWMGAAALAVSVAGAVAINRFMGHRALPALVVPLGAAALVGLTLRGAVVAALRGGVTWRGRLYPSKLLLEGRRIEFP